MVKIEGYTSEELLALPAAELDAVVFIGRPVVVRVGSAEVLAECHRRGTTLVVDLAHIDGGGEGALPALTTFLGRFARSRGFQSIEWLVRATNCAHPNDKLRRVLIRRGFEVRDVAEFGECYYKATSAGDTHHGLDSDRSL
jgi:hypothetical protein